MSPATKTPGAEDRIEASAATAPPASDNPASSARSRRGLTPAAIRTVRASATAPAVDTAQPSPRRSKLSTPSPVSSVTPASRSHPASRSPTSSPSRVDWGAGSSLTRVTAEPIVAREAAASQPMNPEPTTTASWPAVRASASESSTVRMVCRAGSSPPGTGRRVGSDPVASTQAA